MENGIRLKSSRELVNILFASMLIILAGGSQALAEPAINRGVEGPVDRMIKPVLPDYTEAEKQAGHFGMVTVEGDLKADGTLSDVHVAESARASDLDAATVEAVTKWKFILRKAPDGTPILGKIRAKIEFSDIQLSEPLSLTCKIVNPKAKWFRQAFPERSFASWSFYSNWEAILNLGAVLPPHDENSRRAKLIVDHFSAAFDLAMQHCEELPPDHLFPIGDYAVGK